LAPPFAVTFRTGSPYVPHFLGHKIHNMVVDMVSFSLIPHPMTQRIIQAAFRGLYTTDLAMDSIHDGLMADPMYPQGIIQTYVREWVDNVRQSSRRRVLHTVSS
jgi:hypothetical protein